MHGIYSTLSIGPVHEPASSMQMNRRLILFNSSRDSKRGARQIELASNPALYCRVTCQNLPTRVITATGVKQMSSFIPQAGKMKTLFLVLLFFSSTLMPTSATEKTSMTRRTEHSCETQPQRQTKVAHCPRDTPLLLVDPRTPSDEIQYGLTQGAVANSRNPAALPSLVHVTHNSSLLCTPENIGISQVAQVGGGKYGPLAVEASVEAHADDGEGKGDACESPTMTLSREGGKGHKTRNLGLINAPRGQAIAAAHNCSIGFHQSIVVLGEDPVVMESASFLYEKCPLVSTLLQYQKGALRAIRGPHARLTKDSLLVLVGHGGRARGGPATLGGYGPEEVARAVAAVATEDGRVRAVSLAGCELGKDLQFAARLLQALRSLRLETELHLRLSLLSITRSGEVLTQERRGHGQLVWRHQDGIYEVIAWLDGTRNLLTRVGGSHRGLVVPGYHGPALLAEFSEWPTHPQMFTPAELRAKYTSIDCLEGLTWSMFFEENEKRRTSDYVLDQSLAKFTPLVWLAGRRPAGDPPIKHIVTILDLVREIRYVAKENVHIDLYYALNDCVYKVQNRTLYVSIAGKYVDATDPGEALRFSSAFEGERENQTLAELRQRLKASDFNEFCRQTFQLRRCKGHEDGDGGFGAGGCERWGRYFMAAVFSESVRNFCTFALFLVSVVACEVSRLHGPDDQICGAFVEDEHPMAGVGAWLERDRRGFYGCSLTTADQRTKQDKLAWLEQVLHKENVLFSRANACMTRVYGQREDAELGISFIEYFRGTNEGRKLTRGCVSYP